MNKFQIKSKFKPSEEQQKAINNITSNLKNNVKNQTLLGVTGSGKTFIMANVIENIQKPTLILAHNKTLAAQLFAELKRFFPNNSVKYFISYYDYYQPEAYIPQRDLYIEKETEINQTIEKYRNAATQSLLSRKDTIIVSSVSCIYGLGDPDDYNLLSRTFRVGEKYNLDKLYQQLITIQYQRNNIDFKNGCFRVNGDVIDIYLSSEDIAVRLIFFGEELESIKLINPITGEVLENLSEYKLFPAKHFVTPYENIKAIIPDIKKDLEIEVNKFKAQDKMLEAHRLTQRVNFDIEMMVETGYCSGIENYSRYLDRREEGSPPATLLDFFPNDWLLFIDESHITIPQVRGMYHGDRSRKETLVNYGFRLKAALDNRPLTFEEFKSKLNNVIYTSATPGDYELNLSRENVAELLIRPTGLLDPIIDVRSTEKDNFNGLIKSIQKHNLEFLPITKKKSFDKNQIDDLIEEIKETVKNNQRVLVTTLTKRMAEHLSEFLKNIDIKATYIHSDFDAIKRVEVLKELRLGKVDVLIGINLLREGLDLPEVSLIAILDADKEGFLRSKTSLIQIMGRAARHKDGRVIMYADHITDSMKYSILETHRRRAIQEKYNQEHNIIPQSIQKEIEDILVRDKAEEKENIDLIKRAESYNILDNKSKKALLKEIEIQMNIEADSMRFEQAAIYRDLLLDLRKKN